jgi:hypothetical protein
MGSRARMSLHRPMQAGSRHLCRDMKKHADMHAEGTATRITVASKATTTATEPEVPGENGSPPEPTECITRHREGVYHSQPSPRGRKPSCFGNRNHVLQAKDANSVPRGHAGAFARTVSG